MDIFIGYINIIGPLSHFDYINFKVSLVIKIINFNGIKNMAHLVMLVIFHVNIKISILHTFIASLLKKLIFQNENFQSGYMISKHGSNYMK
jgi:hypothetical protein